MTHNLAYLSSFQPLTLNDEEAVAEALGKADVVTLIVGSARASRSSHLNPLSLPERIALLERVYHSQLEAGRIAIATLSDQLYDNAAWEADLATLVEKLQIDGFVVRRDVKGKRERQLSRVAPVHSCVADRMTQWRREEIFAGWYDGGPIPHLSLGTVSALVDLRESKSFAWLKEEWQFHKGYRAAWAGTPYPVKFITADACIECKGRVLLVRRGSWPGKGLWALPGGFLENDETVDEAAARELGEETNLDLTLEQAQEWLIRQGMFDLPYRDGRGRLVTGGYYFRVPGEVLPQVEASDDADAVWWAPVDQIQPEFMMADHFDIMRALRQA